MKRVHRHGIAAVVAGIVMTAASVAADAPAAHASAPWAGAGSQQDVIRGSFTQRKYLPELEQPLVSSGRYVIAAGHGLIWRIEQPVETQLVITRQHLIQRSNGHETARLSVERQPALGMVAAILLAIFQADMDRLRQYFEIERQGRGDGGWTMLLRPGMETVGKVIERVRVSGAAHIQRIEIHQPNGDRSVIELDPAIEAPATLSAEEQAQFLR